MDPTETGAEYEARLGTMAEALAAEAALLPPAWRSRRGQVEITTAAVTVWYWETMLVRSRHSGEVTGDAGRAACLGQIHETGLVPRGEWEQLAGVDIGATRRCARATLRVLRAMMGLDVWRGTEQEHRRPMLFALYGLGHSPSPAEWAQPWWRRRAATWERLAKMGG